MRPAHIPALILALPALLVAPAAFAGPCSTICKNPAYHSKPVYAPAAWRKADHTHVTLHNGAGTGQASAPARGVRVLSPAPLYNARQQAGLAAKINRDRQARAQAELLRSQAALRASREAERAARLSAIEAKQDLILERQKRAAQPRRRVFYGNNRFFGRNGFIGNSNFSGGTVPSNRKRRRVSKH